MAKLIEKPKTQANNNIMKQSKRGYAYAWITPYHEGE